MKRCNKESAYWLRGDDPCNYRTDQRDSVVPPPKTIIYSKHEQLRAISHWIFMPLVSELNVILKPPNTTGLHGWKQEICGSESAVPSSSFPRFRIP